MKKVLIILGGLLLLAVAVIAGLIVLVSQKGAELDASSKEYVDQAVPSIISTWSTSELLDRASPELKKPYPRNK